MANSSLSERASERASRRKAIKIKRRQERSSVPAKALIRERSKSLELEFPPSYSYSSTISCCSVGSQPPRTTEMSVVILSIGPTTHFFLTLRKGAPETETDSSSIFIPPFFFFFINHTSSNLSNTYLSYTQHFHIRSPLFFDYERAGLLFLKTLYRSTYFSYFPLIVKISDPLYRVHELRNNNPVKFFQLRIFINK